MKRRVRGKYQLYMVLHWVGPAIFKVLYGLAIWIDGSSSGGLVHVASYYKSAVHALQYQNGTNESFRPLVTHHCKEILSQQKTIIDSVVM